MRHARDRGIDIYFITWNICPNSVARPIKPGHKSWAPQREQEAPGKYGVTHQIDKPETVAYYRKAVSTFILTYPDLKGIGVTAGENMPPGSRRSRVWAGRMALGNLWSGYPGCEEGAA